MLAIVVVTDIVVAIVVVIMVLLVDVTPVGHRLTVAGHSGPFLGHFIIIFLKVSQLEDGRGAPALNQVLAPIKFTRLLLVDAVLLLFDKVLVEGYHFIDVGLELMFIASVLDVHCFDIPEFVELSFCVLEFIGWAHFGHCGVGLIEHGLVLHVEVFDEGGRSVGLLPQRFFVLLQLLVQPALAVGVVAQSGLVQPIQLLFTRIRHLRQPQSRSFVLRPFVFVGPVDLSPETFDLPHVSVEARRGQGLFLEVAQGVCSVFLEVVFVGEVGTLGRRALPLYFGQSLEVVVTGVEAELSFVVLKLVGRVELEVAVETSVIGLVFDAGIHIILIIKMQKSVGRRQVVLIWGKALSMILLYCSDMPCEMTEDGV